MIPTNTAAIIPILVGVISNIFFTLLVDYFLCCFITLYESIIISIYDIASIMQNVNV